MSKCSFDKFVSPVGNTKKIFNSIGKALSDWLETYGVMIGLERHLAIINLKTWLETYQESFLVQYYSLYY